MNTRKLLLNSLILGTVSMGTIAIAQDSYACQPLGNADHTGWGHDGNGQTFCYQWHENCVGFQPPKHSKKPPHKEVGHTVTTGAAVLQPDASCGGAKPPNNPPPPPTKCVPPVKPKADASTIGDDLMLALEDLFTVNDAYGAMATIGFNAITATTDCTDGSVGAPVEAIDPDADVADTYVGDGDLGFGNLAF